MMKKLILFALACFASATFAATAHEDTLTVVLDKAPNTTHGPLIIANQEGYFKEVGLKVKFISPQNSSDSASMIGKNKADIGLAYEPLLIERIHQGLPIIRIGTLIDKPLNCVIALKQSGIKTLSDLKGKQIGYSDNHITQVVLSSLLQKQGLSSHDFKMVKLQEDLAQALLSKKVDAISGTMRNLEVPMLEANDHKLVVFFPEEHGIPTYSELVFITNKTRIQDPRFPRFLAAIKKAVRYLDEHPKKAWALMTKQYPVLKNDLNKEYWFATLPYFAEEPAAFDNKEWSNFAEFMQQNRLISNAQPVSHYAVMLG